MVQTERLARLREEVDDGRTPEGECFGSHIQPLAWRAIQEQEEIRGSPPARAGQPADLEEEEFSREGEVLVNQPITRVCGGRVRQDLVIGAEADGAEGTRR